MTETARLKDWQRMRLRSFVDEAIENQATERMQDAVHAAVEMGRWRLISQFDPDENGQPIRESHKYLFQVAGAEWCTLFDVAHYTLGLTDEQLDAEVETVLRQHIRGTAPTRDDPVPPFPDEVAQN